MNVHWKAALGWWCAAMLLLVCSCAAPRALWPQKDLPSSDLIGATDGHVVLVASRSSEFKAALVQKLTEAIVSAGMAGKTVGVGDLKGVDASGYHAVVVISNCLAWGLDHDVQGFLGRQEAHANIIIVTTSGDGDWLPDRGGRDFDAISSASRLTSVDGVVRDVMVKIGRRRDDVG